MNNIEFRKRYIYILNKKKVYSCFSDRLVQFVDELPRQFEKNTVISNGSLLIDNCANVEGDIQDMYFVKKAKDNHAYLNMYDYLEKSGMFDEENFNPVVFLQELEKQIEDRKNR